MDNNSLDMSAMFLLLVALILHVILIFAYFFLILQIMISSVCTAQCVLLVMFLFVVGV